MQVAITILPIFIYSPDAALKLRPAPLPSIGVHDPVDVIPTVPLASVLETFELLNGIQK